MYINKIGVLNITLRLLIGYIGVMRCTHVVLFWLNRYQGYIVQRTENDMCKYKKVMKISAMNKAANISDSNIILSVLNIK